MQVKWQRIWNEHSDHQTIPGRCLRKAAICSLWWRFHDPCQLSLSLPVPLHSACDPTSHLRENRAHQRRNACFHSTASTLVCSTHALCLPLLKGRKTALLSWPTPLLCSGPHLFLPSQTSFPTIIPLYCLFSHIAGSIPLIFSSLRSKAFMLTMVRLHHVYALPPAKCPHAYSHCQQNCPLPSTYTIGFYTLHFITMAFSSSPCWQWLSLSFISLDLLAVMLS